MRLALAVVCIVLTSCGHTMADVFRAQMARWSAEMDQTVGAPITELVSQWGPPANRFQNGPETIYEWDRNSTRISFSGNRFGGSAETEEDSCRVWFDVGSDSIIRAWHSRGCEPRG